VIESGSDSMAGLILLQRAAVALAEARGLEKPTSGVIRIGDHLVNEVSARDRDITLVCQNYALYAQSVYKNLAFSPAEGTSIRLGVEPAAVYLFDAATGTAIR
jgi:ABC-type sugar transport system ATPase subunit